MFLEKKKKFLFQENSIETHYYLSMFTDHHELFNFVEFPNKNNIINISITKRQYHYALISVNITPTKRCSG